MIGRSLNYEFRLELRSARVSPSRAAVDFDECAEILSRFTRQTLRPATALHPESVAGTVSGTVRRREE